MAEKGTPRSIAVWGEFDEKDSPVDLGLKLHFNYWRLVRSVPRYKSLKKNNDILDIGIMVTGSDLKYAHAVNIFLPFKVERTFITDLGEKFKKQEIATGVFNESLSATDNGSIARKVILRNLDNEDEYCRVHLFKQSDNQKGISDKEIVLEQEAHGSVLTISRSAIEFASQEVPENSCIYFRLRVEFSGIENNSILKCYSPLDRFISSGYETIECMDFRLNETRNLPVSIHEKMSRKSRMKIDRVDFLLAHSVNAEIIGKHEEFHKSRLLEPELWRNYIGTDEKPIDLTEGAVIYHWRAKYGPENTSKLESFHAFVKLAIRDSTIVTIVRYFFIAVTIGVVSGIVSANYSKYTSGLNDADSAMNVDDPQ